MSGATQPHPACEEFGSALQVTCKKVERLTSLRRPLPPPPTASCGCSSPPLLHNPAMQECIKGHRMFVAALQELEGQLGSLGVGSPTSAKKQSPLMQRVAAAAPSPRLESYLAGKGPQQPPQRRLAELIDDNLQLLQLLAQEQRDLLRGMQGHFEAAGAVAREDAALVEPSLLMAALLDGLQQEVEMLVGALLAVKGQGLRQGREASWTT